VSSRLLCDENLRLWEEKESLEEQLQDLHLLQLENGGLRCMIKVIHSLHGGNAQFCPLQPEEELTRSTDSDMRWRVGIPKWQYSTPQARRFMKIFGCQ
jgi:hypothetical protein